MVNWLELSLALGFIKVIYSSMYRQVVNVLAKICKGKGMKLERCCLYLLMLFSESS